MAQIHDDTQLHIADPFTDNGDIDENVKKTNPEDFDAQGPLGSETNPEEVESEDTLEMAQDMGLYKKADDEHPVELNLANEITRTDD